MNPMIIPSGCQFHLNQFSLQLYNISLVTLVFQIGSVGTIKNCTLVNYITFFYQDYKINNTVCDHRMIARKVKQAK